MVLTRAFSDQLQNCQQKDVRLNKKVTSVESGRKTAGGGDVTQEQSGFWEEGDFWLNWRRVIFCKGDDLADMRHHFFKMLPCED
jgi:hypothetical protein